MDVYFKSSTGYTNKDSDKSESATSEGVSELIHDLFSAQSQPCGFDFSIKAADFHHRKALAARWKQNFDRMREGKAALEQMQP